MPRAFAASLAAGLLTVSSLAAAHHSYTDFHDYVVSVEGTIQRLVYANPHTIITLRTRDGVVYTGNWRAAYQLNRMGVEATSLRVGDVVVVSGTPSRDAAARQLARLREVRRPRDGWTWRVDSGRVTIAGGSGAPN
jgi:hypothetical protein